MRAAVIAMVAVATLAGCSGGGDGSPRDSSPPTGDPWPDPMVAAVVIEAGPDPASVPNVGPGALVLVGAEGIAQWHSGFNEEVVASMGPGGSPWVSVEAIASGARSALVADTDDGVNSERRWAVWNLDTDAVTPLECAQGAPDVVTLLEPRADAFLVLGGCGDGATIATVDAVTGMVTPGEPVVADDAAMWVPDSDAFVIVEGAPGPCLASGMLSETQIAVTCDLGDALFEIGSVTLAAADAPAGTYAPDPEAGQSPQFYRTTAFVSHERHWVNGNTTEGTPLLATGQSVDESWLTPLAPFGERILAARGLDPWGPRTSHDPGLGWYEPVAGEFVPLDLPEGVRGVAQSAYGVPVG